MPQPRQYASNALKQAAYRRRRTAAHDEQLRSKGLPPLPVPAQIPGRARWRSAIESACALLEQTTMEMREYYEERSDAWRETTRADDLLERIDLLDTLLDELRAQEG